MAQNRKPPAYQEYAATILSDRNFRLMTLAERGLFYSMRLECWQNIEVPASENDLAKYLGYESSEIKNALSQRVKAFFNLNENLFKCPELDDYRQHLEQQKAKQSAGGKLGAASTNGKSKNPLKQASTREPAMLSGNPQVPRQGESEFLVKLSSEKQSQNQPLENGNIQDEWVNEYDRASNG
jgi:uncharacterized protein YdaU (DUF1376 family)